MSLLHIPPAKGRRVSQQFEELRGLFENEPKHCEPVSKPKAKLKVLSDISTHSVSDNPDGAHISAGPSLNLGGVKQRKMKQLNLGSISNTADGKGPLLPIGSTNRNRVVTVNRGMEGTDKKKRKVMPGGSKI